MGAAYQSLDLVFATEDGRPIDPQTINDRFSQALARVRLQRSACMMHATFATWMPQAGVSLKTVSDQVGHSSIAITGNVYSYVTREIARAAADTLNQALTAGS